MIQVNNSKQTYSVPANPKQEKKLNFGANLTHVSGLDNFAKIVRKDGDNVTVKTQVTSFLDSISKFAQFLKKDPTQSNLKLQIVNVSQGKNPGSLIKTISFRLGKVSTKGRIERNSPGVILNTNSVDSQMQLPERLNETLKDLFKSIKDRDKLLDKINKEKQIG